MKKTETVNEDYLWYKDAIIYQLHVKTFYDKDENGIGDFAGLSEKLPYLKDLGVTAIWLLPFYPSPLRDDGYDIADYFEVHPDYGTLDDFKRLLKKAHSLDLKVITELVINHTSDQHPWFQRARKAKKGSKYRDFYVWSDKADQYKDARIIFQDFEASNWTWDPVANAYFWHRFYSHQPDLNFDNPLVQKEIIRIMNFWFEMGVDGMRLDAVPYLFEREGTNCENLPETHEFLKKLRNNIDKKFENKMFLAEANQWPEDAVAYFGDGDECHMNFHFPLMPRLYMSLQMEDRYPIIDILQQTPEISELCQWGIFLRNHDELTLEMVTDEERDYMYRSFTTDPRMKINLGIRRRLFPLMNNNRRKLELMYVLLFSLPGSPIIYYGDEIGMGDNYYLGDRDGVRTPMQWSPDRNAGFSKANPQQLYLPVIIDSEYHYETVNVEIQSKNTSSMLWWMRRIIDQRKRHKAFSRGSIEFLYPENPKVLCFIRKYEEETILVIINLSRFAQAANLNLSKYKGFVPEEVFSLNKFPRIRGSRYTITLPPHTHYWLQLVQEENNELDGGEGGKHLLQVKESWEEVLSGKKLSIFVKKVLPHYLPKVRWFGDKAKRIKSIDVVDNIPFNVPEKKEKVFLLSIEVKFTEGLNKIYLLPIAYMEKERSEYLEKEVPSSIITQLSVGDQEGVLYDGVYSPEFIAALFHLISKGKKVSGDYGQLAGCPGKKVKKDLKNYEMKHSYEVIKAEQSNTSVLIDRKYFMKLFRRLEVGLNPDTEIIKFLTEKKSFEAVPYFVGDLELRKTKSEPIILCLMQESIQHQGDAWSFTFDHLKEYYERLLSSGDKLPKKIKLESHILDCGMDSVPKFLHEQIGSFYLDMVKILGERTAQLHLVSASDKDNTAFSPERFSTLYQRSLYQSMNVLRKKVFDDLKKNVTRADAAERKKLRAFFKKEKQIDGCLKKILDKKYPGMKIRIHGDYHLGQVLYTGKDFKIIDFEGEPARSLSERRLKRSALCDVAGMIRSFHYAAYGALLINSSLYQEHIEELEPWANRWFVCVCGVFLEAYLKTMGDSDLIPKKREDLEVLLNIFLLEKAVYELGYEINHRPDWVAVPMKGILQILSNKNMRSSS